MKHNQEMPKVNIEKLQSVLTAEELEIVMRFIKSDNSIRASKPTVEKYVSKVTRIETEYGAYDDKTYDCKDEVQGKSAYVWRQVVFFVSPKRQHQCMPTLDFCDLPKSVTDNGYTMNNPQLEALHRLADKVVDCVSVADWNGVKRWGMAYGQIGTAQVRENGSIVYR